MSVAVIPIDSLGGSPGPTGPAGAQGTQGSAGPNVWVSPYLTVTDDTALDATHGTVGFDVTAASKAATLPTAVGISGKFYIIKKIAGATNKLVTINTTSAQTISGEASGAIILSTIGDFAIVQSDGANWVLVNHQRSTYMAGVVQNDSANTPCTIDITLTRVNAIVTARLSQSSSQLGNKPNTTDPTTATAIPVSYRPAVRTPCPQRAYSNSTYILGAVFVETTGIFTFSLTNLSTWGSTSGWRSEAGNISWSIN